MLKGKEIRRVKIFRKKKKKRRRRKRRMGDMPRWILGLIEKVR